jgi:heat shock protein HtpX
MREIIESNKRKSLLLFLVMGLCLIITGYLIGNIFNGDLAGAAGAGIAIIIWSVLSIISFYGGNAILLSSSNAVEITPRVHQKLFNIVEEMKIAANLPVIPKVYIIEEEMPNAFAVGRDPHHSAIAVTAGLLTRLNRDELQGVIAHEISHIINRDTLYLTFAGVMLGTITLISTVFLKGIKYSPSVVFRYKIKSGRAGCTLQIIFVLLTILFAILGPILARLLYFGISRKREYLADATAARLTRYPEGLASALEKIQSCGVIMRSANRITAPMYIINPLQVEGNKLSNLNSTHPPVEERIRILRNISHSVSFYNYQKSFNETASLNKIIIPESPLINLKVIPIREKTADSLITDNVRNSKRVFNDLIMKANGYSFINCQCGLQLKIPPGFGSNKPYVQCPKCGAEHEINFGENTKVIKCLSCGKDYYDSDAACPFCGNTTNLDDLNKLNGENFNKYKSYALEKEDNSDVNPFDILRYSFGVICLILGLTNSSFFGGINLIFTIALIAVGIFAFIFRKIFPD